MYDINIMKTKYTSCTYPISNLILLICVSLVVYTEG